MSAPRYNPGFLTDEQLIAGFAVRQHDLETLLQIVRSNNGAANQHAIVIAARGLGKTTLVRRVAAELRRAPDLRDRWLPVPFAEESDTVGTVGELWLEALFHLAQVTQSPHLREAWTELRRERDDARLAARALGQLLDEADTRGRRLVLLVENLDPLFGGDGLADRDLWALRKTLQAEPRILILGTAVHRFPGLDQPDAPLFDLFRPLELSPLEPADCDHLWSSITGSSLGRRRAKAMRLLSGGNPRLLGILADHARERPAATFQDDLTALVDSHTEHLRHTIEALGGQNRRVFLALAELWRPATARQVAEVARLNVNEASASLTRLVAQGRVEVARTRGRSHHYQITDRLYSIYYRMRRSGGPDARVLALTDVLGLLYTCDEGSAAQGGLGEEACIRLEGGRESSLYALDGLLAATGRHTALARDVRPSAPDPANGRSGGYAEPHSGGLRANEGEPGDTDGLDLTAPLLPDLGPIAEAGATSEAARQGDPSPPSPWRAALGLALGEPGPKATALLRAAAEVVRTSPAVADAVGSVALSVSDPTRWAQALGLFSPSPGPFNAVYLSLLGLVQGPTPVLAQLRALRAAEALPRTVHPDLCRIALHLAAAGAIRETLDLLSTPALAEPMEPLTVALRLRLNEEVDAAPEHLELADDLNARIDLLVSQGMVWRKDPFADPLPDEV